MEVYVKNQTIYLAYNVNYLIAVVIDPKERHASNFTENNKV